MDAFEHEQRRYDNAEPSWVHDTSEDELTLEELEDELTSNLHSILSELLDINSDFELYASNLKDTFETYFEKRKEIGV